MTLVDWSADCEYETLKTNDPDGKKACRAFDEAFKRLKEVKNETSV